uniref:Pancreatic trypsin inhibitor n=1 Tax=Rhipicephalus zambeziensis TaxID=60191 RepID=A0A224YB58_9ACAR
MELQSCALVLLLCTLQVQGWNCFKNCKTKKKKPTHLPTPSECLKPPILGYCTPLMSAWYYDHNNKKCRKVDPTLCGTGRNLFGTEQQCHKVCHNPVGYAQVVCLIPPVLVSSSALLQTWYFDIGCSCCKRLNYTLGAASSNSFASEEKCQQTCQPNIQQKAICSIKPLSERCLISRLYWYFDWKHNNCFRFSNKRCAKNKNGFGSYKKCMERCSCFKPQTASSSTS